jgi:hypothetical protein
MHQVLDKILEHEDKLALMSELEFNIHNVQKQIGRKDTLSCMTISALKKL